MSIRVMLAGLVGVGLALAVIWVLWGKRGVSDEIVMRTYQTSLPPPDAGLRVFHLGHSLVGRDMPAMLEQLARTGGIEGHGYESQLGWGTSLREHFEPDLEINGFDAENDHPRFRDAHEAIVSGEYDAVVLTEMVELSDAMRYHDSGRYLRRWADMAREGNPDTRVYLYETWRRLDDPQGWLARLDEDYRKLWIKGVLGRDLSQFRARPVRVVPAGQVMAAFARRVESEGGIGGVSGPQDLFARRDDGSLDTIHLNDKGAYLVALTHFATLYHRSSVGLPHELKRADGTAADAPGPEAARAMQEVVWEVVRRLPETGVDAR